MAAPMAGQEDALDALQRAEKQFVGRLTPRSAD
jgi:hypothetical protein